MLVVIIMGSPSDDPVAQKIIQGLDSFGIPWEKKVASAHKTPRYLLELLEKYEADPEPKVYISIAGRSNALGGFLDAQVAAPVIACPPYSDKFGGADIFSSLRMPSGVAPAVVLEPGAAALLAAKILGLSNATVLNAVRESQEQQRQRVIGANQ